MTYELSPEDRQRVADEARAQVVAFCRDLADGSFDLGDPLDWVLAMREPERFEAATDLLYEHLRTWAATLERMDQPEPVQCDKSYGYWVAGTRCAREAGHSGMCAP